MAPDAASATPASTDGAAPTNTGSDATTDPAADPSTDTPTDTPTDEPTDEPDDTPDDTPQTGWVEQDGAWVWLDDDGQRVTGWRSIDDTWYLFDSDGVRLEGWQWQGAWYYLDPETGAMHEGWLLERPERPERADDADDADDQDDDQGGTWYFLNYGSGAMATGGRAVRNVWYLFDQRGAMLTGWQADGNTWYFLDRESGAMRTGWIEEPEGWYYLQPNGAMASNAFQTSYGSWFMATPSGLWRGSPVTFDAELDSYVLPVVAACGNDLRACYDYVRTQFRYVGYPHWPNYYGWEKDYALHLLRDGGGNCYSFACAFHFMAKALGYDTWTVKGYLVNRQTGGLLDHCWVEGNVAGGRHIFDPELHYEFGTVDMFLIDPARAPVTYRYV